MYCTVAEVEAETSTNILSQLSDDQAGDSVVSSIVEGYITEATAYIDSFLRKRYVVPLDPVPIEIRRCTRRLAILSLHQRRGNTLSLDEASEYDKLTAWLTSIQKGASAIDATLLEIESNKSGKLRANSRGNYLDTTGY